MKNPHREEERDLVRKHSEWTRNNPDRPLVDNPYWRAVIEIKQRIYDWDLQRKTAVKETHNPHITPISYDIAVPDLRFVLSPRVKLIYDPIISDCGVVDPVEFSLYLQDIFTQPKLSSKPVYIDTEDVTSPDFSTMIIFFRDLSFVNHDRNLHDKRLHLSDKIKICRKFLLKQKLANISMVYDGRKLVYQARSPIEDDPDKMISQFASANRAYMKSKIPLIVVKKLPQRLSQENLLAFFSVFGITRFFEVASDEEDDFQVATGEKLCTALVGYCCDGDFMNALKTLCGCSLRQDGSHELIDYEVSLRVQDEQEEPLLKERGKGKGKGKGKEVI